jgi:hypothetical protein
MTQKTYPEHPGWTFQMQEVSAGVYEVSAISKNGRRISATGTDLNQLIEKCKADASA